MPNERLLLTMFVVLVVVLMGFAPDVYAQAPGSDLRLSTDGSLTALSLGDGDPFHTTDRAVTGDRLIRVPDSPTVLVLWDELDSVRGDLPFYAISLDGIEIDEVRETDYTLGVRTGKFDPLVDVPAVPEGLSAAPDAGLYAVQFHTQSLSVFRRAIPRCRRLRRSA